MHSNIRLYRAIAEEANAEAQLLHAASSRPKEDGSDGYIITHDPSNKSFKQSLVAIAFSAIYLEALLYLVGTKIMGSRWKREMDGKVYEDKLTALGVQDQCILAGAKRLRTSRRDIVHEKAVPIGELQVSEMRWAQVEAAHAIELIGQVTDHLQNAA